MNIHISRTLKRLEAFLKALTEKNAITIANKSLTATATAKLLIKGSAFDAFTAC
jgi:hypothetical protein